MRILKTYFLLILVICSVGNIVGQDSLTLSDAIQIGLKKNFDIQISAKNIEINKLQNTSSADLNAITITTKPVNFKLNTTQNSSTGTRSVGFDTIDLNPTSTNAACSFANTPFKITYPDDSSYSASWMLYIADIWTSYDQYKQGQAVTLYVNDKRVAEAQLIRPSGGNLLAKIQTFQYIPKGAVVTLQFKTSNTETYKGSTFSGIKIS